MTHRTSTIVVFVAMLGLAVPRLALARTNVAVGLGDQSPTMFSNPQFQSLKIKKARYFIRWDAIRHPDAMAAADAYVNAARQARVRVLMHISTNDLRKKKAKLPSTSQYRRDVGRLVRHFRAKGVREFGVWNEANHASQPTYRSPSRAAAYYRLMRSFCRGCTIVALDVLDQAGVARYIQRWFSALPRSYRARKVLVGIHNYSDTNRRRSTGTRTIIKSVRRIDRHARFWLTETGGVVNFGRSFPCNEKRAASALSYMFKLARQFDRYVERLYSYNWLGANCQGFDAGLVRQDGSLRPGFFVFKSKLPGFAR